MASLNLINSMTEGGETKECKFLSYLSVLLKTSFFFKKKKATGIYNF